MCHQLFIRHQRKLFLSDVHVEGNVQKAWRIHKMEKVQPKGNQRT